ncbi:sugar ABC transporter ATP-binding protein [Ostreiculturibacter nitratireducens]|uniref:sugar ABC transporter ATP-binding protein n=1 Tax=Ostreiculturibacter nitratireducens TaxID=3075226 RepID=UPI0031B5D17C
MSIQGRHLVHSSSDSAAKASAFSVQGVRKAFGATVAVDDVSFSVERGRVHALLGENGAGKSTLVKLLSGLTSPDAGTFHVFGERTNLTSPRKAHSLGIQTAFQEMTLVGDLTVLDAMLMPYAPVGISGMIRRKAAAREVAEHFAALGIGDIDLTDDVRDLDLTQRQKIEIARALFRKPRILLLDEPTSTLSGRDVDWLGDLIEAERNKGTTVVFISHRLREVRDFCETLTILRNGKHITTGRVDEFSDEDVIRMIVGRSIGQAFPDRPTESAEGQEILRGEGLRTEHRLRDVSFSLRRGEILGIAGLQGMGQLDLFLSCFGGAELTGGQLHVDGKPVTITTPMDAVNARIGISLVPEDRKTEALFLKLSGRYNTSIPVISRFARFGLIDTKAETAAVLSAFRRVDVQERALWTRAGAFSGGNQQKIAIAKWLLAESRVLLLYDPTRGIDVGTKHELYMLMRAFADAGGAVLFYSSEIPELVHLADRVLVLYKGRIAREVSGPAQTEEAIVEAALGGAELHEAAE